MQFAPIELGVGNLDTEYTKLKLRWKEKTYQTNLLIHPKLKSIILRLSFPLPILLTPIQPLKTQLKNSRKTPVQAVGLSR